VVLQPNETNQLDKPSEILTFHVRSFSKDRLTKQIGVISRQELKTVKECLNDILTY
jgi:mRNA interferase MazF